MPGCRVVVKSVAVRDVAMPSIVCRGSTHRPARRACSSISERHALSIRAAELPGSPGPPGPEHRRSLFVRLCADAGPRRLAQLTSVRPFNPPRATRSSSTAKRLSVRLKVATPPAGRRAGRAPAFIDSAPIPNTDILSCARLLTASVAPPPTKHRSGCNPPQPLPVICAGQHFFAR